MPDAISVKKLTKTYGKQVGILDLSFSVQEGEIFGFLGPNGAGKTTTIRSLLNFIKPNSGEAKILGLDTRKNELEIKKQIGYLPGELNLYENMTGKEFLHFLAGFRKKVNWGFVDSLAKRFNTHLDKKIKKLSHGNKQKVAILQAFMHEPKLLILDEPTTGLDPLVQHEFYHLLDEFRKKGSTIFISSHNLAEVEKNCDRVAIIKDGQLVTVEEVERLRQKALRPLEIIFTTQVKIEEFEKIPGIKDLKIEGNTLRCTVVGSVDKLIKEAAKHDVQNIISQEPDLEEIFLSFYGGN